MFDYFCGLSCAKIFPLLAALSSGTHTHTRLISAFYQVPFSQGNTCCKGKKEDNDNKNNIYFSMELAFILIQ